MRPRFRPPLGVSDATAGDAVFTGCDEDSALILGGGGGQGCR